MIRQLTQRLTNQLPVWARPENPGIRYTMGAQKLLTRRIFLQQLFAVVVIYVFAYVAFTLIQPEIGRSLSEQLISFIFWPTLILQVVLSIAVMMYTSGAIGNERRHATWDNLRATYDGVSVTLRAYWSAAVFYRQAGILSGIYLVRMLLLGALIFDLTAFRGDYLNYLTGGITPEVSSVAAIVLLALTMTASFILPITGLGFDAAFGLFISTFLRQRVFLGLTQIILAVIRVLVTVAAVMLMVWLVDTNSVISMPVGFGGLLAFGTFGDWGLRYLHAAFLGELWQMIDYGILIGLALLIVAFLQALLTDGLLKWSIHRAQRRE